MTIAFVTETYHPTINGVVNAIDGLADALQRRGHRVRIITPAHPGVRLQSPLVHHVPALPFPGGSGYQLAFPRFSDAHRILREADIIHTHHPFTMGTWAQRIAAEAGKPLVFTNHTQYLRYLHHVPLPGTLIRQPLSSYLSGFANRSTVVVAPAEQTAQAIRSAGVTTPVHVVPNGIDVDRFRTGNRAGIRSSLGISADTAVLLFVGRLSEEKNVSLLLRMLQRLDPPTTLLLAGDGPQREALAALAEELGIQDRVRFLGMVEYAELPDVYAAADVFVSASTSEVHPLTVLEAQAAGLPAVVADAPGSAEIVLHQKTGIVVSPTVTAFAAAVRQLLLRPALAHQYGRAAITNAAGYSTDRSAERLLDTYRLAKRLAARDE